MILETKRGHEEIIGGNMLEYVGYEAVLIWENSDSFTVRNWLLVKFKK